MSDTVQELPYVVATGVLGASITGATTYALPPGYAVDDILLLFVEVGATTGPVLATATIDAGWQLLTLRAQGSNVTATGVFWKRATSLSEVAPQVLGQANHQVGFTAAVRNCVKTGTPWEALTDNGGNSTSASLAMGSVATSMSLVLCVFSSSYDSSTPQFATITNPTLSSLTEQKQGGTFNGNGGSVALVTGTRATPGSGGTFSAAHANAAAWTTIGFALKSYVPPVASTVGTLKVVVGGVKKTATAYVIVGGVKKNVVSSTAIRSGAKRAIP